MFERTVMYKSILSSSLVGSVVFVCFVATLMPLTSGHTATFGAVEGAVRSNQLGTPVVGAVVSIKRAGHSVELMTDSLGDYRVDNLIAGRYRLAIKAIGYESFIVDDLNIVAGNTISQISRLVLAGEGDSDDATSQQDANGASIVTEDEITRLPARTLQDFLLLQPTIIESRSNAIQLHQIQASGEPQNGPQIHVMGGNLWDEGYSVNGVNFTEPINRSYTASVSPHAIDQLVFLTGSNSVASSAGNAGVVEILTRPGGEQYSCMVEAVTDNGIGSGYDQNWYTARLSGPIPFLNRGFFMSVLERRWLADRNPSPKTKDVLPGSPDRLPNNWQSGWSYHGRADYDFTDDLSITLTGDKSTDEWSGYRHAYLFNMAHTPRYQDDNLGLSSRLAYRVNDNVSFSLGGTFRETERIQGDGVVFDDYEAYERKYIWPDGEVDDIVNPGLDDFDLFYVSGEPVHIWNNSGGSVYESYDHYFGNFMRYRSSTVGVNGEIGARIGQYMIARAGFEYSRHTLRYFENLDATMGYYEGRVIHYGYDSLGRESDSEDWWHDTKHPSTLAFYVQDRFSYKGFALVTGLRWEQFDYKGYLLRDSLNPFSYGEPGVLDEADLVKSSSFNRFSPNVRASYSFRDRVRIHAGFGMSHQLPPLRQIYNDWQFFEARVTAGSYYPLSNAGIEPVRSSQFDVGVTFHAMDRVSLSLAGFWRESTNDIGIYTFDSVHSSIHTYSIYAGGLESKAKGLTAGIKSRITNELRTSLNYTWSKAESLNYLSAGSPYVIIWSNPYTTNLYAWTSRNHDRRHNFVGNLAWDLGKQQGPQVGGIHPLEMFRLNLVARMSSGRPYTPMNMYDAATEYPVRSGPIGPINSERMDWISTIDLRTEREVNIGGVRFMPFLWIKNIFNTENIADVWNVTGEPDNTGYLESEPGLTNIENFGLTYEQKYRLKQANPQNYGPPRQLFFGIRAEF